MKKLKDFQLEMVDIAFERRAFLNGDKMGLGKTITAIGLIMEIEKEHYRPKVTIVCPASLILNWQSEISEWLPNYTVNIKKKFNSCDIDIVSYGTFKNNLFLAKTDLLVFDEAHFLKNEKTQRTQAAHIAVARYRPYHLFLLSGTPITNGVGDYYSLLKLLNKVCVNVKLKEFPTKYHFLRTFCYSETIRVKRKNPKYGYAEWIEVPKWFGLKNKDKLKEVLKPVYKRRTPEQVYKGPKLTVQHIILENRKELAGLVDAYTSDSLHNATLRKQHALSKVKATAKFIKDLRETGEPIVVFSDHPQVLKELQSALSKEKTGLISQELPADKRQEVAKLFQSGEIDIIFLTFGTGAMGFTLTRANTMVINDLSWDTTVNDQAFYRIKRISQERDCVAYVVASGLYDKERNEKLTNKGETINEATEEH